MASAPQEPFWLGTYAVKLGSRSTIPTQHTQSNYDENDENYTHQQQHSFQHHENVWNISDSGTLVIIGVFICVFLQVFPLTMWHMGWSAFVRCSSSNGQYILTSSAVPARFRRAVLYVFRCCLPSLSALSSQTATREHHNDIERRENSSTTSSNTSSNTSSSVASPTTRSSGGAAGGLGDDTICSQTVPRHIAIIMDGNRRYGHEVHGDTGRGHADGGRTLSRVIDWCLEVGVQVLTVYAFSTENWNRAQSEIDLLMDIFVTQSNEILIESKKRNVQVKVLSSAPEKLPTFVQEKFQELERETRHGSGMTLNLCVSYGGRGDIVNACQSVVKKVMKGKIRSVSDINEEILSKEMLTGKCLIPDPDLLIRTSGERRLSNFLLWQVAYSELIFIEKHWPAVTRDDMMDILQEYSRRKRRFGK